ncbi:TaqI-like C-terminal specificity domain-containing protein [Acetanaerobacterium elongatum]|uniref:site-specific DNA-methyltransferase (adenine-specific) n=1 Tax=Acetanaerobacterium elongatum TaxID=258515 RepID=A0A1G9U6Q3_9FIRM|nr:TaqI-like C-terminal specificity domain-containing protein [Acetanaerobacterium elongatum]SDM55354.1 Helix-turn-helix domain-containing protein [Acetanaerobacterium elongatum]
MRGITLPEDVITIEQTCSMLMISQATARNWVKNGKLKPVKTPVRKLCFAKKDVERLLLSIQSGESESLTRRRNKTKHTGNVVPAGYVAQKEYTDAAKRIVASIDTLGGGERLMRLILAEYSMKLLAGRGLIKGGVPVYLEEYLKNREFLAQYRCLITDMLPEDCTASDIKHALPALTEEIEYIKDEDFLGLLYMSISSIAKRKTEGVYYTPKRIAEDCAAYLLKTGTLEGRRILDPCCGTGNFIVNIFHMLHARNKAVNSEQLIAANLFAADIDPISICLARVNLTLAARLGDSKVLYTNLKVTDSLFDFEDDSFDVIISNPPWGSAYEKEYENKVRERYAHANLCYVESFAVFLLKAIQTCKAGGTVCYVLPQSFLNVMAHDRLRGFVVKNCDIIKVKYWRNIFDKVYAPTITITLRKGKADSPQAIEVENGGAPYTVSPLRLQHSSIFNFSVEDEANNLIVKLDKKQDVVRLLNHADFALGIVTGDNRSFLKDRRYKEMEPVLRGTDIYAYTYSKPEKYLRFDPKRFQQVAPEHFYRAPEKLIYKFVSSSLCFAYDDKQTLSLNSCNILIPRFENIPIKYVLAVLNSSAAHFYFTNKFQSVKVLRSHIEDIPIPLAAEATYRKACQLVDEVIAAPNAELRLLLIEQIDTLIMDAFELTPAERRLVKAHAQRLPEPVEGKC